MSALVSSIEILKKHITINYNFDFDYITPYIIKAERKHIKAVIGEGMYEFYTETPPDTGNPLQVLTLLQEASANLAMLAYTFVGVVQISDNGFHISSNQNSTPAEWWQIRDLRRSFLNTGNEAIDEALKIMEANEIEFEDWPGTEGYTVFKQFFVRKTQDFQQYFNIENSRLTFLKMRPHLQKAEDKYFKGLLGQTTIDQIKAQESPEAIEAFSICQPAQVSLTVSELANEGAFIFTPNGIYVSTTEIPGEKKAQLAQQDLYNLHRSKQVDGNEYLTSLVAYLKSNEDVFSDFAAKEANQVSDPSHNTDSLLSV